MYDTNPPAAYWRDQLIQWGPRVVFAILILNFVLFRLMPGSPERQTRNPNLRPEVIAAARERWGLDKPLLPLTISVAPPTVAVNPENQLFAFIGQTIRGDLG